MIRRPPRSTPLYSSAASDVYKRQDFTQGIHPAGDYFTGGVANRCSSAHGTAALGTSGTRRFQFEGTQFHQPPIRTIPPGTSPNVWIKFRAIVSPSSLVRC